MSSAELEIAELKKKLAESESRVAHLMNVVDQLPVALEVYDAHGFARHLNPAMLKVARLSSMQHAIGRFNILTDPFSIESGILPFFERAYSGELVETPEFMIEMGRASKSWGTKSGELWCRLLLVPSFDSQQQVQGVTCIVLDTQQDRKMAEAITQLSRRDGIELLAGGVAHDFHNLLTAIITNAQMLTTELSGSESLGMAEDVLLATRQASFLTRQLFSLTGRMKPDVKTHNICQEAEEMARLFNQTIQKTVKVEFSGSSEPLFAEFDQGQIRQVLMNLVTNAIDSMAESSGVVSISATKKRLTSLERKELFLGKELSQADEFVKVTIKDTGVGIHPEVVSQIFEPYVTTKRAGHGLGLAAALKIIASHEGAIGVESVINQGTVMSIYLPLSVREISLPSVFPDCLKLSCAGSVFVIDDSDYVRAALCALLSKQGLEVIEAQSGEEALSLYAAQTIKPELIVCDLMVGAVNGFDVMKEIRAIFPRQKFLLMGAHYEAGEASVCEDSHASFLKKPFDMQSFLASIGKLSQHTEMHRRATHS